MIEVPKCVAWLKKKKNTMEIDFIEYIQSMVKQKLHYLRIKEITIHPQMPYPVTAIIARYDGRKSSDRVLYSAVSIQQDEPELLKINLEMHKRHCVKFLQKEWKENKK